MLAFQPLSDFDGQTFSGEHIEDGEGPESPAIRQLVGYENPGSTPDSGQSAGIVRVAAARRGAYAVACAAGLSLPRDTAGTPVSCPLSILPGSAAPGFCGSHSAPGFARSPASASAGPFSVSRMLW